MFFFMNDDYILHIWKNVPTAQIGKNIKLLFEEAIAFKKG